jgi:putative redox protein
MRPEPLAHDPSDGLGTPLRPPERARPKLTVRSRKEAAMERAIRVDHKGGDLFEIAVRQHVLHVDQPIEDGGSDAAPTPTEMFVASLASCVAFYVRRFLLRHDLPTDGLAVTALFSMSEHPARVGEIQLSIQIPGVPEDRRAPLLAVASHCTVHNSLEHPPVVTIGLAA